MTVLIWIGAAIIAAAITYWAMLGKAQQLIARKHHR